MMPMPDEPRRRAEEIRKQNERATQFHYDQQKRFRDQQSQKLRESISEYETSLSRNRVKGVGNTTRSRNPGFLRLVLIVAAGLFLWYWVSHDSPSVNWAKCGTDWCSLDD